MSSISIKTGFGRNKSVQQQEQKPEARQTFPVFGIMAMILTLALLGLMLFAQPSAPLASAGTTPQIAPQTLSLSGAITSRIALEDAAVQCSSTDVAINGTAPMAYSVNYTIGSSAPGSSALGDNGLGNNSATSNTLSVDGTSTLTLSINSSTAGIVPNVFTAYDGVVYTQNGRTFINANLTNNAGQPLYINATVACN